MALKLLFSYAATVRPRAAAYPLQEFCGGDIYMHDQPWANDIGRRSARKAHILRMLLRGNQTSAKASALSNQKSLGKGAVPSPNGSDQPSVGARG